MLVSQLYVSTYSALIHSIFHFWSEKFNFYVDSYVIYRSLNSKKCVPVCSQLVMELFLVRDKHNSKWKIVIHVLNSWLLLEEVIQRTWLLVYRWAIGGSSQPPCPWSVHSVHHPHGGSHFQGHSLERIRCYWTHLDWEHDWTHLRPLYKFKVLGVVLRTTQLASKRSFACKFPCLSKLLPTDLQRPASFHLSWLYR